jgi:cellulose biosynthesis protein BcsQ
MNSEKRNDSTMDDINPKSQKKQKKQKPPRKYDEENIAEIDLTEMKLPLVISLFAHKGGVGKTTMTLNVAKTIMQDTKTKHNIRKILLIDADPQMNLTHFVLQDEKFDKYSENVTNKNFREIPSSILNLFLRTQTDIPAHPWVSMGDRRIDLISGSFENSNYMVKLSMDINSLKNENVGGTNTDSVHKFIETMKSKYDLIMIDLNPSLNPLNQSMLRETDLLYQVMCPDSFSKCGLKLVKMNLYDFFPDGNTPHMAGLIFNKCFMRRGESAVSEKKIIEESKILSKVLFNENEVLGIIQNMHSTGTELGSKHLCIIDCPKPRVNTIISNLRGQMILTTQRILQSMSRFGTNEPTNDDDELEIYDFINERLIQVGINSQ